MRPIDGDTLERGGSIAGRSRLRAIAGLLTSRAGASIRSSRTAAQAQHLLREFRTLPARERTRCALITLAVAVGGHVLLVAALPTSSAPTVAVTAIALLGAGLAVVRGTATRP